MGVIRVELGELTWPEVPAGAVLLVPLGSTEQHGPHLPLDTDTRLARGVALAAAARPTATPVLVAPALPVTSAGEHGGFPGTLSIGREATRLVLVELIRSATRPGGGPFLGAVIVSGHGGNLAPVGEAVALLQSEGRNVSAWFPRPGGDAHAGRTETSLIMHLAPELVRGDRMVAGRTEPVAELLEELVADGVAGVSPSGVLGDPTAADAAVGAAIFEWLVDDLCESIRTICAGDRSPGTGR